MMRVVVIGWNQKDAEGRAEELQREGLAATALVPAGPEILKTLQKEPPDAIVIDLERRPAGGRDLGLWLRSRKTTREIPLVFAGGSASQAAEIRTLIPGAGFCDWATAPVTIRRVRSLKKVVKAQAASVMAAYAGRPLAQKLGIRPGVTIVLVGAPRGFEALLGDLPANASTRREQARKGGPYGEAVGMLLWFVRSRAELEAGMAAMAARTAVGRLWICWPKQGSVLAANVTQNSVREAGLAAGLVDFKICAIDADWSGLCCVRRRGR